MANRIRQFDAARELAEKELSKAHANLKGIIESTKDMIAALDTGYHFIAFNEAYAAEVKNKLGIKITPGMVLKDVFQKKRDLYAASHARWARALSGEEFTEIIDFRNEVGGPSYYEMSFCKIINELGHQIGATSLVRDITERKKAEDLLEETVIFTTTHDLVTELFNRSSFEKRLETAIGAARERKEILAVVLMDSCRFREINETFGHEIGDRLLKTIAFRLRGYIQDEDKLACLGGDKFAVLLSDIENIKPVEKFVKTLSEILKKPYVIGRQELILSECMGISIFPQDGENSHDLLKNADIALNYAKFRGGAGIYFCTSEMTAYINRRMELKSAIQNALTNHEFVPFYQPELNLKTGKIVGFEVLVRWIRPDKQMILPAEFIPLAEETGLILSLGEYVLKEACRQNKAWHAQGMSKLTIAVNLSARQCRDDYDLIGKVKEILEETGLDPSVLELEITESLLMSDVRHSADVLRDLKKMGVKLAIDDFGTGYSSLSYLKRFAVDCLKIDQSFIRELFQEGNSQAIVLAMLSLADKLGIKVVAEGIETVKQLAFLRQHHCAEGQGYYFSPPVSAAEATKLQTSWKHQGAVRPRAKLDA